MSAGVFNNTSLYLVDNFEDAQTFISWLGTAHENDIISFDTETEGLRPWSEEKVRLIQIGDSQNGFAFPPEWHGLALDALRRWGGDTVGHNTRFDASFLLKQYPNQYQPDWRHIQDTMTMALLDDSTRPAGLKPLTGMLISPAAVESQDALAREMALNNWNWATVPITRTGVGSSYWIYAALDPVLTCRLYEKLKHVRTQFAKPYDLEMNTLRCILNMERKGMRIDLAHSRKMIEEFSAQAGEIRQWITDTYGVANPGSAQQCLSAFEELGREATEFTGSGGKSLNKTQLQKFIIEGDGNLPGADLARAILEMRKIEKQIGPYFEAFEDLVDADGFVRPNVRPMGARTSRMSITSPALQTLPKGDPAVRDAFIAREGHIMGSIDADQIEFRLAAHFSQDKGLRTAFTEQPDVFNYIASELWARPITKADPERSIIKGVVYGRLYGAGAEKMALTAGVPVATIEEVMARFNANFPGLTRLARRVEAKAQERVRSEGRPYVITPMGRRLYGDVGKEYALTNYICQSHAAELLKQGICDLDAAGLGEYMDLPVHDEIIFEAPKEDFPDVIKGFEEVLNNVGKDYFVPLTWGADCLNDRWGSKYHRD